MNKTVTINISGIIFHIEEDAYNTLSKYLSTIKGYFSNTDGGSEIMSDIEARIAELLKEKVSDYKQVVLMADVEHVMNVMGKPEDFAGDDAQDTTNKQEPNYQYYNGGRRRRMFRDPDTKIAGGVCAGFANYFDIDSLWIRISLVILVFMSVGILIPLYVILWVIIPEARTTAEKLEMHGEPIDINNISKTVKEEAGQFKDRMQNMGERVKSARPGDKVADVLKQIFGTLFKIIYKILGVFLIFIGIAFMIATIAIILNKATINGSNAELYVDDFLGTNKALTIFGLIILIGIPAVMLLYKGIKILFGIKYHNKWINLSAGIVWTIGMIIVFFGAISIFKELEHEGKSKTPFTISNAKMDTLYISADTDNKLLEQFDAYEESRKVGKIRIGGFHDRSCRLLEVNGKKIIYGVPQLKVIEGESDSIEVTIIRYAAGKEKQEAMMRAKRINYNITQIDSLIKLNALFNLEEGEKLRDQEVVVQIKVPKGVVVFFDKSLLGYLSDIDNVSNTWDNNMVGRRWQMTTAGLKCIDCDGLDLSDVDENFIAPPVPPTPPILINNNGININDKDANVKVDKNGINIKSKDGNVKIDETGININTKDKTK